MRYLLHHLLQQSAQRYPERLSVVDGDRSLSYRELETRANQLAHHLLTHGVAQGDRVGIFLDKSIEAVASIHGVLKAGAVYVPLDLRAPVIRLAYVAADCGLRWLVTNARRTASALDLVDAGALVTDIVTMDGMWTGAPRPGVRFWSRNELDGQATHAPSTRLIDADLAYILYTSGSTGEPKGVMLSHRNALAFVEWAIEELSVGPDDRLSSHAPFHFDLSIFDLFAAAGTGACVHLVPAATSVFPVEVARFIDRELISVWYSVPSILSLLAQHGTLAVGALPSLRAVIFAGEVFPSKYLAQLMAVLPRVAFHNWYGPTETNVCTAFRVESAPDPVGPDIPIGRPIANVETVVVAIDGERASPGSEGELLVRGATVMRGYWGDPKKTALRLVPHPFDHTITDLCYRTGDLVIEQPDGCYRFLGRRDHQVKSRGYRIELGEIETALNAHPDVVECVGVAVPDETISNRIEAHVVVRGGLDANALATWCAIRLPRYMIPEAFHFVDALPKTSTGKIDRRAVATTH